MVGPNADGAFRGVRGEGAEATKSGTVGGCLVGKGAPTRCCGGQLAARPNTPEPLREVIGTAVADPCVTLIWPFEAAADDNGVDESPPVLLALLALEDATS